MRSPCSAKITVGYFLKSVECILRENYVQTISQLTFVFYIYSELYHS